MTKITDSMAKVAYIAKTRLKWNQDKTGSGYLYKNKCLRKADDVNVI